MKALLTVLMVMGAFAASGVHADQFSKKDLQRWEDEFKAAAKEGRTLFDGSNSKKLGSNGVSCTQCHPNAANTHPETYPKFQKQIGKVAALWEMVNWCIRNPLQGKDLAADSKEMIALQAYIASERKGVKMAPGKH